MEKAEAKPRILTFVAFYLPGFKSGGPVRTIANMVDHLGLELDFWIVTSDRDALDTSSYPGITVDAWNTVGKAKVFYASPKRRSLRSFAEIMRKTPHDVLYLNSFFDPVFTLRPLLARKMGLVPKRPTVIAPRGEFSKEALALKWWKKFPYLTVTTVLGLYQGLVWQASSNHEAQDILLGLPGIARHVEIAPDLPPSAVPSVPQSQQVDDLSSPLRIVFLSRITPMKNLDFAIQVLKRVKIPVHFHIYGPVRDSSYWRLCRKHISDLPRHVLVQYLGSVNPTEVIQLLGSYDLFFLPTKGENFGHVVLEALSAGTPALISDQTPWPPDAEGGCTVVGVEDMEGFARAIEKFAALSKEARMVCRNAARKTAERFIKDAGLVNANLRLFLQALSLY